MSTWLGGTNARDFEPIVARGAVMAETRLDASGLSPYSPAHDQRRDHSHASPPHLRGTGGRGRLRSPLPPDTVLRQFLSKKRKSESGGSKVKQELDMDTPANYLSLADTRSQQIARLMRHMRPQTFADELNRLERSVQ